MGSLIKDVLGDADSNLRHKITCAYAMLLVFNIAAWLWAFIAFHHFPLLMGTSLLAYSFGRRHAVDADHIAAIDNVTRKWLTDTSGYC